MKKIKRSFNRVIALTLLHLMVFSQIGIAASISLSESSCLSPAVKISVQDFNSSFGTYFLQQAEILSQTDTTKARVAFSNDLYELPFKILFPQIIQYHVLNTIKQKLLANVDEDQIVDIQVEYASDDRAFKLFEEQGEKELNQLIGNKELKELFLPFKVTRNWSGTVLEGYDPTQKTRNDPIKKEKYDRSWLLGKKSKDSQTGKFKQAESLQSFTGYTTKELKKLRTAALWKMYFQYKIPHVFGQRLENPKFKVMLTLKNGAQLEAYITMTKRGKGFDVSFEQTKGAPAQAALVDAPIEQIAPETFDERIQKTEDVKFRQEMHIMQSQKKDLNLVTSAIKTLRQIKDVDLADWQNGRTEQTRENVKQALIRINLWLEGKKQEKHEAYKLLEQIIKSGYLKRGNYTGAINNIDTAISKLHNRMLFLVRGIGKRNMQLLEQANEQQDYYLYAEVIKNELMLAEAALRVNEISIALSKIENLESEILRNTGFEEELALDTKAIEEINSLRGKLEAVDAAKPAVDAINRIREIENNKTQIIEKLEKSLNSIKDWFTSKGFTGYAAELTPALREIENTAKPGVNFYLALTSALRTVDTLAQKISKNDSKKISPLKKIIALKFSEPIVVLNDTLEKILKRHEAIKKVLKEERVAGAQQAIELLEINFRQMSGYDSIEQMRSDLIGRIQFSLRILSETQNGFAHKQEFTKIGDIIPEVMEKLINQSPAVVVPEQMSLWDNKQPIASYELIGQAI